VTTRGLPECGSAETREGKTMKNLIPTRGIGGLVVLLTCAAMPLLATADNGPHTIAAKAFDLRMAGQVDEAVQMLESGLAAAPEAGVLHYELARTQLLLLDIPAMREEALAAVRCAPDDNTFRYFAAMASGYAVIEAAHHGDQARMKELGREALDQLDAILATDPDHHEARWLLVQLSTEMAPDLGLEVEDPETHVALLERKDPILGAKARCCLVGEEKQCELWRQVLAEHPEDSRALAAAAEGLIQAGELDLAEECLTRAIGKNKEHCYGLLGLGLAYFMRQDWEQAKALTQRYLDTNPPLALRAYAVGRMGMIHHRAGDDERAKKLMEEARKLDPHVWQTVTPPPQEIFTPI
jgi:tetratricopeptide (TPR) repeat protein